MFRPGNIWNPISASDTVCALILKFFSSNDRNGLDTKVEKSRKQMKERKNSAKKVRGVKKTKAGEAAKKK
ncbi:40S ribosomal S24-1 -like protein [Gossypium arboreum]|uniref:40S ribosomal S24-1-like protein n=1 Tax=Gossypium arboreum TaxID=29729 RepID=A0A0B0PPV1_GOSAR|nr:40S ribosomal S24-1 -like protein [Gossypium arboreum]